MMAQIFCLLYADYLSNSNTVIVFIVFDLVRELGDIQTYKIKEPIYFNEV